MKTVFITGLNGFLGAHCARFLSEQGFEVTGIGRQEACALDGVRYTQCDVRNEECVSRVSEGVDVFLHLAGITTHEEIVGDPFSSLDVAVGGTMALLRVFKKSGADKFLFASTGKVYGKSATPPYREEIQPNPTNILGKLKYACERVIECAADAEPAKSFSVFRIFNVYGQGQREQFLIPTILSRIRSGNGEIRLGDINAKRDYVYVDDVVSAFYKIIAGDTESRFSAWNVGSGAAHSASDIVECIERILEKPLKILGDISRKRKDESDIEYCSNEKLKKLSWSLRYSLEDGLRDLLQREGFI